jgi:short subunit dehydrogenase-like uncharacterized protein
MENRKFDLIIWGATGFTGQLVAEYLWREYGHSSLKWAIAGRDEKKLQQVSTEIGLQNVPYLLADSFDLPSLKKLASQAKVICSTVGPYAIYGNAVVQACVEEACHYCDLTGEVPWMRKMIDQHHQAAFEKSIKIVHTCGFDSIPSDVGVREVQQSFFKKYGYYADKVYTRVAGMKGELSGGTYASMSNLLAEANKDKDIQKIVYNSYSLNPDPAYKGADKADFRSVQKDPITGQWMCPFVMAVVNTRVVRRSHALADFPYGHRFSYEETMLCGKGFKGRMRATAVLMGLGLLMAAKPGSFLKKLIDKRMPKPGEGPSEAQRKAGRFKFLVFAEGSNGDRSLVAVRGDMDPGYGSTSKMLAESALCLVNDELLPETYGVLTPSVAIGEELHKRLEAKAGVTFEVVE